jgi:hypothetical protein
MIKIIITCVVLIIILLFIYLLSKKLNHYNNNYNNNLQDVVDRINDTQYSEYEYDNDIKAGLTKVENSLVNYETKKELANQVTSESIISNQSKLNTININNSTITSDKNNNLVLTNDANIIVNNLKISKDKIDTNAEFNLAGYPIATQTWTNKNSMPQWDNIQNKPDILKNNMQTDAIINNIRFGKTGFPSNNSNYSEIINDTTTNKQLIIAGNKSSGVRKVGIWDQLDVHGNLNIDKKLSVQDSTFDVGANNDLNITNHNGIELLPLKLSKTGVDITGNLNNTGKITSSTNLCINDACLNKDDLNGVLSLQNNITTLQNNIATLQKNLIPPKIDCVVSNWSGCDKPCGGGTQTRSVIQPALNGGVSCPTLTQSCNQQACQQDCVVSNWSACDKTCGGGTQTRTVTQQAANGGIACPALSQVCNPQGCPVDCVVSNWNGCDKTCGGGTQTRTITTQPTNGGQACPALSQVCNQQACAVFKNIDGMWQAPVGWQMTITGTAGPKSGKVNWYGNSWNVNYDPGTNTWQFPDIWGNPAWSVDSTGRLSTSSYSGSESYKFALMDNIDGTWKAPNGYYMTISGTAGGKQGTVLFINNNAVPAYYHAVNKWELNNTFGFTNNWSVNMTTGKLETDYAGYINNDDYKFTRIRN